MTDACGDSRPQLWDDDLDMMLVRERPAVQYVYDVYLSEQERQLQAQLEAGEFPGQDDQGWPPYLVRLAHRANKLES